MEQKKTRGIINNKQKDVIKNIYVNYYNTLNLDSDEKTISKNVADVFAVMSNYTKEKENETYHICLFVDDKSRKYKIYIGNKKFRYDLTEFFKISLGDFDDTGMQEKYEKQIHRILQDDGILCQILAKMQRDHKDLTADVFLQRCSKYDVNVLHRKRYGNNVSVNITNSVSNTFTQCLRSCCS